MDGLLVTDADGACSHSGGYIVLHVKVGACKDQSSHFTDD